MLMKPYPVKHNGKVHIFKELCDAFNYCDKHLLPYPDRLYEPDGQPHAREMYVTGAEIKKNRERQRKESKENREIEIYGRYQ